MKQIEWKLNEHRIGPNSYLAKIGKVTVGSVHYTLRSKGEPEAYSFQCNLPGFSRNIMIGNKPTIEKAKARLEELVKFWFKEVD